jgi:hypothetical protein
MNVIGARTGLGSFKASASLAQFWAGKPPILSTGDERHLDVRNRLPTEISISLSSEVMQELRRLVRGELARLNLAQTTIAGEAEHTQCEPLPSRCCRMCGASVPSTSLFCPKCDSFQGAVMAGQCHDGESRSQHENLALPKPLAFGPALYGHRSWRERVYLTR